MVSRTASMLVSPAAFLRHIFLILLLSCQKQMLRIYASTHITFMAYKQAISNRTEMKFVRKAMGIVMMLSIPSQISIFVTSSFIAGPQPASVCFRNIVPESCDVSRLSSDVFAHEIDMASFNIRRA